MLRTRMAAAVAATLALTALACWAASARAATHAKAPTRIVSLSPTATEDLFAIGAGRQVIAVDDQSNYPKQAPTTKLSSYKPNAEAIAKYRPDLVVVSNDGGIVAALHKLGIRTLLAPAAANLTQAYAEIAQLGAVTGHAAGAANVVTHMKAQLARVVASVPHEQLKVFVELSPDLYSATSKTFIGSLFTLFGLTNIADGADKTGSGYPQLSNEYVIAENPDIVVLSDTKCCGQGPKTVASRPGWSTVNAVRHQGVVAVSDDVASRWGPRIVQFAKAIAAGIRRYE